MNLSRSVPPDPVVFCRRQCWLEANFKFGGDTIVSIPVKSVTQACLVSFSELDGGVDISVVYVFVQDWYGNVSLT